MSEFSEKTRFQQGNKPQRSKPCKVTKGIKPGIYTSFSQAAKANRTYSQYLIAIAKGKFKSSLFVVSFLEEY